jgi:hypothetical protein
MEPCLKTAYLASALCCVSAIDGTIFEKDLK